MQIKLSKAQVKKIILSVPDIRNPDGVLANFGDIRYDGFARVLDEAIRLYAGGNAIAAIRNDFFGGDHALWLKTLSSATGHDGATTNPGGGDVWYIAWWPEQIKSAIGNSGSFDPRNPSITERVVTPTST